METTAFNITTCDGGAHRRKDSPNGGMPTETANTLAALTPTIATVAVSTEIKTSQATEECRAEDVVAALPDNISAPTLSSLCDEVLGNSGAEVVALGCFNMGGNKAGAGTDTSGASPSILAQHGTNPRAVAIGFKAGQSANGGLGDEEEVAPTMSHQPSALEPTVVYPINGMVLGKAVKDGDRQTTGRGKDNNPVPTLQTQHHHAVAICGGDKTFAKVGHARNKAGDGERYSEVEVAQTLNTFQNNGEARAIEIVSHEVVAQYHQVEAKGFSHIASGVMLECSPKNTAATIKACAAGCGAAIIEVDGHNKTPAGETSPTISGAASDFHHGHGVIVEGVDPYNGAATGELAATIGVNCGISTGRNGVAIALEGNGERPSHQGGGFNDKEVSFTLNTIEHHGVAIGLKSLASAKSRSPISVEHAQALSAGCHDSAVSVGIGPSTDSEVKPTHLNQDPELDAPSKGVDLDMTTEAGQIIGETTQKQIPPPLTHIVRRLTVKECERLMGFPDNYTRIPWGIYKDAKKKGVPYRELLQECDSETVRQAVEGCPDSPRYKALGNSWATNCAEWVLRRIVKVFQDEVGRNMPPSADRREGIL